MSKIKEINELREIVKEIYFGGNGFHYSSDQNIDAKLLWALQLDIPMEEWRQELKEFTDARIKKLEESEKAYLEKQKTCKHKFRNCNDREKQCEICYFVTERSGWFD